MELPLSVTVVEGGGDALDLGGEVSLDLAFPNNQDLVAEGFEGGLVAGVALLVGLELGAPVGGIGFGGSDIGSRGFAPKLAGTLGFNVGLDEGCL